MKMRNATRTEREAVRDDRMRRRLSELHHDTGFPVLVKIEGHVCCGVTLLPTSKCECDYADPWHPFSRWPSLNLHTEEARHWRRQAAARRRLAGRNLSARYVR